MSNNRRPLIVFALLLNFAMLALVLVDYYKWDSNYAVLLFIIWCAILLLFLVLLLMPASSERVIERVEIREPAPFQRVAVLPPPVVSKPAVVAASTGIPFVFNGYTLYSRKVELKSGGASRDIYFFSKKEPKSGHLAAKPGGFHVGVNERTGLPFLKRGTGKDGEDLTPSIEAAPRPQCAALTAEGDQCRNPSRDGSKYCASHFGYQPPAIAKAAAGRADTKPRYRGTPDTKPSVRRKASAA